MYRLMLQVIPAKCTSGAEAIKTLLVLVAFGDQYIVHAYKQ